MTIRTATVAPQYSSVYVAGATDVPIPLDNDGIGLVATDDCINVGCLYFNDGDTRLILGHWVELEAREGLPRHDAMLNTPDGRVLVFDVNDPEMLSISVREPRTRIRIWTNHPTEPDEIVIAVG